MNKDYKWFNNIVKISKISSNAESGVKIEYYDTIGQPMTRAVKSP